MHTKVTLFIQCLVDTIFPDAGDAMVEVLKRLKVPMDYPASQTCCGQPSFNSGYFKEAKAAARRFVKIFENAERIVCPSGSCVHMVRHHYPQLFKDEDMAMRLRVKEIGNRCYEFSEYLVDVLGAVNIGAVFPSKVTYHDSCHLVRGLGIRDQPRKLLSHVEGLQLVEMKDSDVCCGFGGTFSLNYPEISTALVDEKIDNILASGADVVTGCDVSCLMNVQGRISRRGESIQVKHIAEILAAGGEL